MASLEAVFEFKFETELLVPSVQALVRLPAHCLAEFSNNAKVREHYLLLCKAMMNHTVGLLRHGMRHAFSGNEGVPSRHLQLNLAEAAFETGCLDLVELQLPPDFVDTLQKQAPRSQENTTSATVDESTVAPRTDNETCRAKEEGPEHVETQDDAEATAAS